MKFVHLANVELGAAGPELPRILGDYREARHEDFKKALALCKNEKADALFVTGDLFCHEPSAEELENLDRELEKYGELRIIILPGLLDHASVGSAYATYRWKSNTTVFIGDCIQRVFLKKLDCEVTGCGYNTDTWSKVKPEKISRGKKGSLQIVLLPFLGQDGSEASFETANTFEFEADYIGLGQKVRISGPNGTAIYAPGLFEPEEYAERPCHGCFLVTADAKGQKANVSAKFVPLCGHEMLTVKVSAYRGLSYDDTERLIEEAIGKYGKEHVYRILIQGEASPSLYIQRDRLYQLGNITEICDETDRRATLEQMQADCDTENPDVVALFLKGLTEVTDEDVRKKAMEFGIQALLKQEERDES